jgi:hypothetical protein
MCFLSGSPQLLPLQEGSRDPAFLHGICSDGVLVWAKNTPFGLSSSARNGLGRAPRSSPLRNGDAARPASGIKKKGPRGGGPGAADRNRTRAGKKAKGLQLLIWIAADPTQRGSEG